MSKYSKNVLVFLCLALLLFFVPWLWATIKYSRQIKNPHVDKLETAIGVVFGANITSDLKPTEILKQRLDSALFLYHQNLLQRIVVSNTYVAANAMRNYLLENNVPADLIDVDSTADTTLDTCRWLRNSGLSEKFIFLSQGYHLPRIMFLCERVEVNGLGVQSELFRDPAFWTDSLFSTYKLRLERCFREAGLIWLIILGVYT